MEITPSLTVYQHDQVALVAPVVSGSYAVKALSDGTDDHVLEVQIPYMVDGVDIRPFARGELLTGVGETMRLEWVFREGGRTWKAESVICQIETATVEAASITLTGHGLLSRVRHHTRRNATQYPDAKRAVDVIRDILAEDNIALTAGMSTVTPSIPTGWVSGTNRWQALTDMVKAIPARLRHIDAGVALLDPLEPAEEFSRVLRDGDDGTVVSAPHVFDRFERPNHVIVRGKGTDGDPDFAEEAFIEHGPYSPAEYGWVTVEVEADAVTTPAGARHVAVNRLYELARNSHVVRVTAASDWEINIDDAVIVEFEQSRWAGRVVGVEWPADGLGEMTIEVGVDS